MNDSLRCFRIALPQGVKNFSMLPNRPAALFVCVEAENLVRHVFGVKPFDQLDEAWAARGRGDALVELAV